MMPSNTHRGEISAILGGSERRLCLTLGALAHLENEFQVGDLNSLCERFSRGHLSANDLIAVLHAGLLGAGHDFSRDEVAEMQVEGGIETYARIVAQLLTATFGQPQDAQETVSSRAQT